MLRVISGAPGAAPTRNNPAISAVFSGNTRPNSNASATGTKKRGQQQPDPIRPTHAPQVLEHLVEPQAHANRHHQQKHRRRNTVLHRMPLLHPLLQT
jgi:hypothetical protein